MRTILSHLYPTHVPSSLFTDSCRTSPRCLVQRLLRSLNPPRALLRIFTASVFYNYTHSLAHPPPPQVRINPCAHSVISHPTLLPKARPPSNYAYKRTHSRRCAWPSPEPKQACPSLSLVITPVSFRPGSHGLAAPRREGHEPTFLPSRGHLSSHAKQKNTVQCHSDCRQYVRKRGKHIIYVCLCVFICKGQPSYQIMNRTQMKQ
jgi:hypothetical protein